jgi:hypothetical protein
MGELYDMNLKGCPLAYTPFCDNNKDMDGYRFWKQVSHLFTIKHAIITNDFSWSHKSCFFKLFADFSLSSLKGFWKDHLRGRPYHIRLVTSSICIN